MIEKGLLKTRSLVAISISIVVVAGTVLAYTTFGSGNLVLKMKDPPSGWGPAEAVYITFTDIMIHRADAGDESGWFSTGVSATNLSLVGMVNVSKVIGQTSLQAGLYNIVRFNITQAIVTVKGVNYTCTVESGKLNVPITGGGIRINAGQTSYLEIDINPTITGKSGNYKLAPAARAAAG